MHAGVPVQLLADFSVTQAISHLSCVAIGNFPYLRKLKFLPKPARWFTLLTTRQSL
jgi:hypothetical protein